MNEGITASQLPLPPEHMRVRVSGISDPDFFCYLGKKISLEIRAVLASVDANFSRHRRSLDFGCGCGRVMRFFIEESRQSEFHAVDIDPEAIAWCSHHLESLACWQLIREDPPMSFPDHSFDIIYAISVFTHLSEVSQLRWLEELRRVLKPQGVLLISVHSAFVHPLLTDTVQAVLKEKGFLYIDDGGTPGLPESYQTCFHTRSYILEVWSKYFDIERYVDRAFIKSQDAVILRHKAEGNL